MGRRIKGANGGAAQRCTPKNKKMNIKNKEKIKSYLLDIKKIVLTETYTSIYEREHYESMLINLNFFIDEEQNQIDFIKKQKEFYL